MVRSRRPWTGQFFPSSLPLSNELARRRRFLVLLVGELSWGNVCKSKLAVSNPVFKTGFRSALLNKGPNTRFVAGLSKFSLESASEVGWISWLVVKRLAVDRMGLIVWAFVRKLRFWESVGKPALAESNVFVSVSLGMSSELDPAESVLLLMVVSPIVIPVSIPSAVFFTQFWSLNGPEPIGVSMSLKPSTYLLT